MGCSRVACGGVGCSRVACGGVGCSRVACGGVNKECKGVKYYNEHFLHVRIRCGEMVAKFRGSFWQIGLRIMNNICDLLHEYK